MGPVNKTQETLRALFANVIGCGLDEVMDDSDFFAIGGDSVGALRVATAALQEGLQACTIPALYSHPILADLGTWCDANNQTHVNDHLQLTEEKMVGKGDNDIASMLAHWQLVETCLDQLNVDPDTILEIFPASWGSVMHQPLLYDVEFEVRAGAEADLISALERVHREEPAMRTRLFEHDDKIMQVVLREDIAWERKPGKVDRYHLRNRNRPMERGGRLVRYAIVASGEKMYVVWTISHAIAERLSRAILIDQVVRYWRDSDISPPIAPSIQSLVARNSNEQHREIGIRFWKERLHGLQRFDHFHSPDLVGKLDNLAKATVHLPYFSTALPGITQSTICHVAWALCLAKLTGLEDIFFFSIASGRQIPDMDLSRAIGFVTCRVPFRLTMTNRNRPLLDFMQEAQMTFVRGFAHEHFAADAIDQIPLFTGKHYFQSVFNYSSVTGVPTYKLNKDNPDGTKESLNIAVNGPNGWFNPPPTCLVGIRPEGDGRLVYAGYDQNLVPPDTMSTLLDDLKNNIMRLSQVSLHDGKTIGDFWPETAEQLDAVAEAILSETQDQDE